MQVSTHDLITPAANKQHKIEDQLPEYFNHGRNDHHRPYCVIKTE